MPYVQVRVSLPLTDEQIKKLASEALNSITLITGKTAAVTMAEVIPACKLYFGTVDAGPCAIVDVAYSNSPDPIELKTYSENYCKVLSKITGIDQKRIYIKHYANPEWHTGKMFI